MKAKIVNEEVITINIMKPEHISSHYDSYILLKFVDELDYAKDLIYGNLFIRSLNSIASMEKEDNEGRADVLEDKLRFVMPTNKIHTSTSFKKIDDEYYLEIKKKKREDNDDLGSVFFHVDKDGKKKKAYCTYSLWYNSETGKILNLSDNMESEFGKYCCVIYNTEEFMRIIEEKFCNIIDIGFINYKILYDKAEGLKNPFIKDKNLYGHQNEFRFLLNTENEDETNKIFVSDRFKDYISVYSSKDVLSSLQFCDGKLMISNSYSIDVEENNTK